MSYQDMNTPGPLFDVAPEDTNHAKPDLDLRTRLKNIHQYIYANDRFKQHAKVFEETIKVLFLKVYDETSAGNHFRIKPEEKSAAAVGDHEAFLLRMRAAFASALDHRDYSGVFRETESLDLSARVLFHAVSQLQPFSLSATDAKGAAFQAILGPQIRGEKGQFFTPDPVRRLILEITDPAPGECVLDPACGSAGLLIQTIERLTRTKKHESRVDLELLFGIEIDPALVRVARLNILLQGAKPGNILAADALGGWQVIADASNRKLGPETVDLVITNPPFGTRGKVDDRRILSQFPNVAADRNRQVPDILFLERIVQLLKPGGRAGIVLPYGDLANSSLSYVREFLRRDCHIFAVVSLPGSTFKPSENSVKAAVLFIRKWPRKKKPKRYPTFRAVSRKIGYDIHERVTYLRHPSGSYVDRDGQPIPPNQAKNTHWLANNAVVDEDISGVIEKWRHFRSMFGKEYLW
jgi:type I restriction enzyme M protein